MLKATAEQSTILKTGRKRKRLVWGVEGKRTEGILSSGGRSQTRLRGGCENGELGRKNFAEKRGRLVRGEKKKRKKEGEGGSDRAP